MPKNDTVVEKQNRKETMLCNTRHVSWETTYHVSGIGNRKRTGCAVLKRQLIETTWKWLHQRTEHKPTTVVCFSTLYPKLQVPTLYEGRWLTYYEHFKVFSASLLFHRLWNDWFRNILVLWVSIFMVCFLSISWIFSLSIYLFIHSFSSQIWWELN